MAELTLEEQIEKIIIDAIIKKLDFAKPDSEITSATKLDDIGIDVVDAATLYPVIIANLTSAGVVANGFKFKDAERPPGSMLPDFNLYWTVGDLVKQVLSASNPS